MMCANCGSKETLSPYRLEIGEVEMLCNPCLSDQGYFEIELRNGEIEDLRLAVDVQYNEAWEAWQVGYTDEDGEYNFSLVRGATTRDEAHMKGIEVVKEHGFIRGDLWVE
jgi:hypothetical protein